MMIRRTLVSVVATLALATTLVQGQSPEGGTRLKDVASLQGISSTPVIGYGLVVGLNKTGDKRQTIFSTQTLANMLQQFGVAVPAAQMKVENIAAVLVTAELPAYAHNGTRIDVTASSVGDARSLQGGVLMPTALRGPNGQVIATAQGALSLGGFGGGTGGNNVQVNHLTVGRVPSGALVHVDVSKALPPSDTIALSLKDPDFITADRISQARQPRARRRVGAPRGLCDRFRSRAAELSHDGSGASGSHRAVVGRRGRRRARRHQRTHGNGRRRRLGASRSGRRGAREPVGEDFDTPRSVAAGAHSRKTATRLSFLKSRST